MAYCTEADLLHRVDEDTLSQLTSDTGGVDSAVVDRAISAADEEIDGYLAVHYTLPFAVTPDRVRDLSADIAIYNLYGRRDADIPENRKDRYRDAVAFLRKLAEGKAVLDVPDPSTAEGGGIGITTSKSDRVFTRGKRSDRSRGTLDNF
jgi:phage gp36-like protein